VLVSALSAAPAGARSAMPVELEWNAPPECPRVEEVQERIQKLAGSLDPVSKPKVTATVTRRVDGLFQLRLVIVADELDDERRIEGRSCNDLAGAAAVTLVLLLQSIEERPSGAASDRRGAANEAAGRPRAAGEPDRSQAAAAASQAAADDQLAADERLQRASRQWHVVLQLPVATLGLGPLRTPSWGLAAAAGLSFEGWRLLAGATAWRKQSVSATNGFREYGGDIQRVTAELLVCRALFRARFEISPCGWLSMHHLWAQGAGAHVTARTAHATWLGVGAGAQASFSAAPWLAIFARAGAELETARPELSLQNAGTLQELRPVAATFALGTEWIF